MIPEVVLIATCSFDRSLGAERVAGAIARGLARVGHDSLDQCPLTWDGSRREQLLAELDERRFDERLRACRALIVAEPSLQEPTLRASATFELATIGNAFHRFRRDAVARNLFQWLDPGGHLALLWSDSPWHGDAPWQAAYRKVLDRWHATAGAGRVPANWEESRTHRPDRLVLAEAGFESLGEFRFLNAHLWSIDELIGFAYSTSFLPRQVLGASAPDFEAEVRTALDRHRTGAGLRQVMDDAYELYLRPAVPR